MGATYENYLKGASLSGPACSSALGSEAGEDAHVLGLASIGMDGDRGGRTERPVAYRSDTLWGGIDRCGANGMSERSGPTKRQAFIIFIH